MKKLVLVLALTGLVGGLSANTLGDDKDKDKKKECCKKDGGKACCKKDGAKSCSGEKKEEKKEEKKD